jgi:hypothetical protein
MIRRQDKRCQGAAAGGLVCHVCNRANARRELFDKAGDYQAFEQVLRARSIISYRIVNHLVFGMI